MGLRTCHRLVTHWALHTENNKNGISSARIVDGCCHGCWCQKQIAGFRRPSSWSWPQTAVPTNYHPTSRSVPPSTRLLPAHKGRHQLHPAYSLPNLPTSPLMLFFALFDDFQFNHNRCNILVIYYYFLCSRVAVCRPTCFYYNINMSVDKLQLDYKSKCR